MRIGYFPGCSLHATAREFDESLKAVTAALGIELDEVQDWACCGASSAHATSRLLGIALPARTLALAAGQQLDRVLAPCAACYNRLASARHAVSRDPLVAARVAELLGRPLGVHVAVVSIAQLLSEVTDLIRDKTTVPLRDLRIACYYGCLLVRPPEVCGFDDAEAPSSLERIAGATGAKPVAWSMALECCGGGFSLSRTGSVVRLGRAILDSARAAGAQAILVACPMCHSNLDFRQRAMGSREGAGEPMPILFVTQLVGLALGLAPGQLGLSRHFVSPGPLVARLHAPAAAPA